MNTLPIQSARRAQAKRAGRTCGVTLIELMVGLAIGLITTLAIAQILMFAEGQKRATTGGSDAQTNGSLALYTIQRDAQMAGYGLTTNLDVLGCEMRARYSGGGPAVNFTWTLAPVSIVDGASGAPDAVALLGSDKAYSVPVTVTVDHSQSGTGFFVKTGLGVAKGDLMLAVPSTIDASNWCSVFDVSQISGSNNLVHGTGSDGAWNQSGASSIFPVAGYPAGSYLINLGRLMIRTYSVSASQSLQVSSLDSATGLSVTDELFPQVVNLQAMYGKDTDGNGAVDTYDNATPTTNAGWRQVLTARIVVVARSASYDKDEVTTTQPVWNFGSAVTVAGSAACGSNRCVTLEIDGLADWKHYRYKVFETVVPVRNMLWSN